MHFVFVTNELATDEYKTGGLGTFTANMAKIFKKHGHSVDIILATTKKMDLFLEKEIPVTNCYIEKQDWDEYANIAQLLFPDNSKYGRATLLMLKKADMVKSTISIINDAEPIDIIHCCNHGGLSLFFDGRIPYVLRVSGLLNILRNGAMKPDGDLDFKNNYIDPDECISNYCLRRLGKVICPSELIADVCRENLGVETTVIENPFIHDESVYDNSVYEKFLLSKKFILFFGTMSYLKGIHVIGGLSEKLLENFSDYYLVTVGKDLVIEVEGKGIAASEYIANQCHQYKNRYIHIDAISRNQLLPIIKNAEICLLPSRIENLSNACIEAMALGKIVVATKGASFEQIIDDGVNGFLCERDNVSAFYNGVCKALSLTVNEKELIEKNAKLSVSRMSSDVIYEKYLEYYLRTIEQWDHKKLYE